MHFCCGIDMADVMEFIGCGTIVRPGPGGVRTGVCIAHANSEGISAKKLCGASEAVLRS